MLSEDKKKKEVLQAAREEVRVHKKEFLGRKQQLFLPEDVAALQSSESQWNKILNVLLKTHELQKKRIIGK